MPILYIAGEISTESFHKFSKKLHLLELELEDTEKRETIDIELISEGGDAYAALAYASRIRNSPAYIRITAHGLVASAAVLILASGDYRQIASEAWFMVHEDSGEITGDATYIEKMGSHMRNMENQWAKLLADKSKASAILWASLHKETKYLTAQQCLNMGVVDKII